MAAVYIVVLLFLRDNRPTSAETVPFYNWPLPPGHSNLETTGHPSAGTGSCLAGDIGHPSLDYNSLKLTGSAQSSKQFSLDTSASFDSFTYSVFVSPIGDSGTIFHFEKQDQSTGMYQIKGLILSYSLNDSTLVVFGDNDTDVLVNISVVYHFAVGNWHPIAVEYDFGAHQITMWVGTSARRAKFKHERKLGVPGKLRVGGSFFPEYSSYNGRATCLQFYNCKLGFDFDAALENCLSSHWPPGVGGITDNSYPACDARQGYYEIVSKGKIPTSSTSPIANLNITSKVRCADFCDLPSNECVSFAINRLQKSCKLYDVNDSVDLVSEDGTDFYVSQTHRNCC